MAVLLEIICQIQILKKKEQERDELEGCVSKSASNIYILLYLKY
jgi:hypothetical protein